MGNHTQYTKKGLAAMRKRKLFMLNSNMVEALKQVGAKYMSASYNFDKPFQNVVSSYHFFKDNVLDANGTLPEVAYFMPSMNSYVLGKLSGFKLINRRNAIDIGVIEVIDYGQS
jgi:hypothetical protein